MYEYNLQNSKDLPKVDVGGPEGLENFLSGLTQIIHISEVFLRCEMQVAL